MPQIIVLGAAAGGGFPQWNCNCQNCQLAWQGSARVKPRTQSSLIVGADAGQWILLNASPDIRQQIAATPELHPQGRRRHTPLAAAVLTNADVDHIAGLLTLRERQSFRLYATRRVQSVLQANSIMDVLKRDYVKRDPLRLDEETAVLDAGGNPTGIRVRLFAVPGKVALYLEDERANDNFGTVDEDTVGVEVTSEVSGNRFYYLPGCAAMPKSLRERLRGAELVFMDGTTWTDNEMSQVGVGDKTSQRMGHMTMSGERGSIALMRDLDIGTRVFVHINNTNPVLRMDSDEYREASEAGWIIAEDGMRFEF